MNAQLDIGSLEELRFHNRFVDSLPGDPQSGKQRRQVSGACYSLVEPTPVAAPSMVAWSDELAATLGWDASLCESELFLQVFSGNRVLDGMQPYAMCYGGHQFGNWAGQLGDGRAINLGEVINPAGEHFTLQLKGAGLTPYSRTADGLAVLRSSIREFLCSEAMHHLGVPTTRALSLVLTGEQVIRDMLYDGNPAPEPGAVVCRVAPSFLRFGSYQLFPSRGEVEQLKTLVDFTLATEFPQLGEPGRDSYLAWLREVCRLTALMIVHWQRVGFVHGVMNTDNMSVLGLTIDYGPYGWLEDYDPDWTPNTTDAQGRRYRYGHQPQIAMWNLVQLANALYPLVEDVPALEEALQVYPEVFEQQWLQMMLNKLGYSGFQQDQDKDLLDDLLALLARVETDMTIFYRQLAGFELPVSDAGIDAGKLFESLAPAYYRPEQLDDAYRDALLDWVRRYNQRLQAAGSDNNQRVELMNRTNPKYVLRNYMAQQAIEKSEQGDHGMVRELFTLLKNPYDEQPAMERYYARRPEWARVKVGCSMLSCSS